MRPVAKRARGLRRALLGAAAVLYLGVLVGVSQGEGPSDAPVVGWTGTIVASSGR